MKKFSVIIILVFISSICQSQIITTFAGIGKNSYSGEGTPATSASFPDPTGGVFDKYGNYYFASALNGNRICKIDTLGVIHTVAGNGSSAYGGDNGAATDAKINGPLSVKIDALGNLYIADYENFRIRKVDISTGIITTIAGTGTHGYNGDNIPATNAMLYGAADICFDKLGNLYIAETVNERIRKINTAGIITTYAGTGTGGYNGDGIAATTAQLNFPNGLAIDDTGNIYIAEDAGNRVRKVNTAGIITTVAGNGTPGYVTDGIPATNAQINPIEIAIDSFDNLYIADEYNYRVFKVDNAGIIHCVAGNGIHGFSGDGGPATAAALDFPSGVALDACGNLYIPLADSDRIQKVTFNPTCDPYSHGTTDSSSLSVSAIATNNITIYPNPATATLSITASNKITQITISSLIGQVVYTSPRLSQGEEKEEVNISGLPEGMYIVKVTDSEGRVMVTKIVKE